MAQSRRTGEFPPLSAPSNIDLEAAPALVRDRVEKSIAHAVFGTPDQVAERLHALVDRTEADEIMISTSTYDRDALFESDAAVMELAHSGRTAVEK